MTSSLQSPLEATVNEVDLPVIDISQFPHITEGADLQYHPQIAKLREACKDWGFFRLVNHGIPEDLLQKVQSVSQYLVWMPMEVKDQIISNEHSSYFHLPGVPYPYETFGFLNMPNPDSVLEMSRKIWPQEGNSDFCEAISTYSLFVKDLAQKITKLILASLGLDVETFYRSDFEKCTAMLRINGYSCHGKLVGEQLLPSHADPGCVTLLHTNDVEGLQFRSKEGNWFNFKPLPDSLIVNLGDSFKAWTNGRYRSAAHRVICKGLKDRISVPLFYNFPGDTQIWAPELLINKDNPRRYKPFVFSDLQKELRNNKKDRGLYKSLERLAGI